MITICFVVPDSWSKLNISNVLVRRVRSETYFIILLSVSGGNESEWLFYILHVTPPLCPSLLSHPTRVCHFNLHSHTFLPFKTRRSVMAVYVCALLPVIGVMVAGTVLISLRWITFITDTTLDSDNRPLQGHRWILRTRVHVSAEQSCYYLGMDFPLGKDWVRYDWIRMCGEYCQTEWGRGEG